MTLNAFTKHFYKRFVRVAFFSPLDVYSKKKLEISFQAFNRLRNKTYSKVLNLYEFYDFNNFPTFKVNCLNGSWLRVFFIRELKSYRPEAIKLLFFYCVWQQNWLSLSATKSLQNFIRKIENKKRKNLSLTFSYFSWLINLL